MPREDIPIIEPYNPLDRRSLGANVAAAVLASPVHTLPPEPSIGAGVYAAYYRGDLAPYKCLVDLNKEGYNAPIYAGEAVPAGARKGGLGMSVDRGPVLFSRLSKHFGSVSKVNSLSEKDFMCRYLVVNDIWIPLAESMLIKCFKPLWNRCTNGFGDHDPGKGRH